MADRGPLGSGERPSSEIPGRLSSGSLPEPDFPPLQAMTDEPMLPEQPDPGERELVAALTARRGVPEAGFRGPLGRYLASIDPGYGPRPARLRLITAGYVGCG